jgi:hypothetical protein
MHLFTKYLCLLISVGSNRPASSDRLDDQSIPIRVPLHVTSTTPSADTKRLYFMAVYDMDVHRSGSSSGSFWKTSRSSNCSFGYQREDDQVEGLVLGQLIGRGSYGSVYAGTWFGSKVAVKVRAACLCFSFNGHGKMSVLYMSWLLPAPQIIEQ